VSQIRTESYFLEESWPTLPVLSISMAASDFKELHLGILARGPSSEKPVSFEVLLPDGRKALGTNAGMRLHGNTGRAGDLTTKKSYRLYFRDLHGDGALDYPLIPRAEVPVQRIVLRAGNDDAFRANYEATYVRDQLIRDLHEDMGAIVSRGDWYNLFVNMEFKGLYNVVERIDGVFMSSRARDGAREWDIVRDSDVTEGDPQSWDRSSTTRTSPRRLSMRTSCGISTSRASPTT
jgi:hypothetical protein